MDTLNITCNLYCNHEVHRDFLITLYIYDVFLKLRGRSPYAVYNFSCITVYRRPDDGSQLQLKYADVEKSDKNQGCV